jgi:hypothetical protein
MVTGHFGGFITYNGLVFGRHGKSQPVSPEEPATRQ